LLSAQIAYGGFPKPDLGKRTTNSVLTGGEAPGAMPVQVIGIRSIDDMLDLKVGR
jgi:hypothetical protein